MTNLFSNRLLQQNEEVKNSNEDTTHPVSTPVPVIIKSSLPNANSSSSNGLSVNEKKATEWMQEEVDRMHNLVQELQSTCNLTAAMYQKEVCYVIEKNSY